MVDAVGVLRNKGETGSYVLNGLELELGTEHNRATWKEGNQEFIDDRGQRTEITLRLSTLSSVNGLQIPLRLPGLFTLNRGAPTNSLSLNLLSNGRLRFPIQINRELKEFSAHHK